jgi:hypothetical protein
MGIIKPEQNKKEGANTARFGYLECYRDVDAFTMLMDAVEMWAKQNGMNKIIGPMGFSDQDPEGFIIQGHDQEPTLATYFNFEYIPAMLESRDYRKEVDYVVYLVDLIRELDPSYEKIYQRFLDRTDFTLLVFTHKRSLKPFIKPIMELMNETFTNLYGYSELTPEEIDHVVKRFWPLIDPRFVLGAKKGNTLAGFLIGVPNLSEGFRKCRGRLFPFGIFKLISAAKKSKQLDLLVGGIKDDFRGKGLDVWGLISMIKAARRAGFTVLDSHHELETNARVRAEMERLGGKVSKRFRIYGKSLEGFRSGDLHFQS